MLKSVLVIFSLLSICASSALAVVNVTSPNNGGTYQGSVHYVASATTSSCAKGVGSMGIYTAPGVLAYVVNGASMNTNLSLAPGTYHTVVEEWDNCGGAGTAAVTITVTAQSGVYITAPVGNGNVGSPVTFTATATTTCSKGVGSMGIYTAPYQLAYVSNGASLSTNLPLSPGRYNAVVEEWDNCGGAATAPVTINVTSGGYVFSNLQRSGGWATAGQGPPDFIDCNPCGPQITFSMEQGIRSPSLSGNSTQFDIGGTGPYWDVRSLTIT